METVDIAMSVNIPINKINVWESYLHKCDISIIDEDNQNIFNKIKEYDKYNNVIIMIVTLNIPDNRTRYFMQYVYNCKINIIDEDNQNIFNSIEEY